MTCYLLVLCFVLTICPLSVVFSQSSESVHIGSDVTTHTWLPSCPTNCSCQWFIEHDTFLAIDCSESLDEEQLTEELDILLSTNITYGRLKRLSIVKSPLRHVPRSICRLTTLTKLELYDNRLVELPDNCLNNLTALMYLYANDNHIAELQDGVFDGTAALQVSILDNNRVSSIGLSVFSDSSGLSHLNLLSIERNRLTSLEPWFYSTATTPERVSTLTVNLLRNQISSFTNKIGAKFSCDDHASVELNFGYNRIRHLTDILRGWNITETEFLPCISSSSIKLELTGNPIDCDCEDYTFYPHYSEFGGVHCASPPDLKGQDVTSVSLEKFICEIAEKCPPRCRCVRRPWNDTLHIYCADTGVSNLPLELPNLPNDNSSYKLDFSNNEDLRRLEHRDYFANSSVLDVSNSSVREVDNIQVWAEIVRIPTVNFFSNKIVSLPPSFASVNISTKHLNLAGNPWDCSCDKRWMSEWLKSNERRLIPDVLCYTPSRLRGKSIIKISGEEFCVDPTKKATERALAISLSSTVGGVLLLLSVGIVVYRLRTTLYTRWKFHPFDRDECHGEDMDYDVFLCYSSQDDKQPRRIVDILENKGFRVCMHERDFLPGVIFDNIELGITRSKRVVCLLTEYFRQSSYCMHEFKAALGHCVKIKRTRRLIVLMALDNPSELLASDNDPDTASLRQYLRQYTYIDYTADDWLDKLLYALPMNGMRQPSPNGGSDDDQLLPAASNQP